MCYSMTKLLDFLKLEPSLQARVEALLQENRTKLEEIAAACENHDENAYQPGGSGDDFSALKNFDPLWKLCVVLLRACNVWKWYQKKQIPEEIYLQTMSDIRIWCENHHNNGVENSNWLHNHVSFQLFRIGRLQFQFYPCYNETFDYSRLPFPKGEPTIYIHIPQGEPLDRAACVQSIRQADDFLKQHFPEYTYHWYFCESWLLYEKNREFMRADSNILRFGELFTHCYSEVDDAQAIERIFGERRACIKDYPEATSLQRRAKAYLQAGKKLGVGLGVIEKK